MIALVLLLSAVSPLQGASDVQTQADGPTSSGRELSLSIGAQGGFPFLVGVRAGGVAFFDGKPRFSFDFVIEPSAQLQSLSVGGAYQIADSVAFVGARLRYVQVQPVWSRDYDAGRDNHFGLGLEAGVRIPVADRRGLVLIGAHVTLLPAAVSQLRTWFGLTAGFSWEVWRTAL